MESYKPETCTLNGDESPPAAAAAAAPDHDDHDDDDHIEAADLPAQAGARIALGKRLLATLDLFRAVDGVQKIERKIGQEVKFLERVVKSGQLKVNHVLCSNLVHYESLTETLLRSSNIKHIDFPVAVAERQSPLRVDIVSDNGSTWIKGESGEFLLDRDRA